jgi:Kdo2-lipid A phosphotransferase
MNDTYQWSPKRLLIVHAALLLLLLSWLFEPTRGLWLSLDEGWFRFSDQSLKKGGDAWRLFWAVMNHEWFDYLFGLVLLSVFIISGLHAGRERWAWHLAVISVAAIAAFIGTRIGNLLPIDRYSATLEFRDAFHLSEWVSGFKTKDYSDDTFPGDHGVVGFIIAGFSLCYLKRGYGWASVVLAVMYVIPRLVAGAHWLSDELVGAVFVCGIILAWFFYTPLAKVLVERFEAVWSWLLQRVLLQ